MFHVSPAIILSRVNTSSILTESLSSLLFFKLKPILQKREQAVFCTNIEKQGVRFAVFVVVSTGCGPYWRFVTRRVLRPSKPDKYYLI